MGGDLGSVSFFDSYRLLSTHLVSLYGHRTHLYMWIHISTKPWTTPLHRCGDAT